MDPIADMLIQIKNAGNAGKESVLIPYSKIKFGIATLLLREGYVSSVINKNNKKGKKEYRFIEVGIARKNAKPKIQGVSRMSKLSRRFYMGFRDVKPVRQGYGDLILSTPKGLLTGKDARKQKIGGEVLFKIW